MRALASKKAAAAVLTAMAVAACGPQPHQDPEPRSLGNDEYLLADSPFTRKGTVITASCSMGARYAGVAVYAWDPESWTLSGQRNFAIPENAVFSSTEPVNSALVDLCRDDRYNPSPYGVGDLERMSPRIRALFDVGFTRMAVVLQNPESKATYAASVPADGDNAVLQYPDGATGDEQNAVMSPDGSRVWFTYTAPSGEQRIGSRAIGGDPRLSDEGPGAGHDLPLVVSGKPPLAIQADMVRVSPNGRRFAAKAPEVFGNVFDAPGSSAALTRGSARGAVMARDCAGVVGWIDDDRVLCRTPSGSFQGVDARSGNPVGAPIGVTGPDDGTVAEGMLVSADGRKFIVAVHLPNNQEQSSFTDEYGVTTDFRVLPTAPGGDPATVSNNYLSTGTMFLDWL